MAAKGSILLAATLLLLLGAYTSIVASVFWRIDGMQLKSAADPIESTTNMEHNQCLGVCLHNPDCKAFNVYPSSSSSPSKCDFFAVNKCSVGTELVPNAGVSYFDTIGNKQCEMRKLPWSLLHGQAFYK